MDIEKKIMDGKMSVTYKEEDIQEVIQRSKAVFAERESESILSYHEFLLQQLQMTHKIWWMIQVLLLSSAWYLLEIEIETAYIKRELGIVAAMFVIFIIPELWKNLNNRCMEIEMTTYYSLRKIYAARLLLFGGVDLILITIFSACVYTKLRISMFELITIFLLPLMITAGICFLLLSFQNQKMGVVIIACTVWSVIWWIVTANESLYKVVTVPVWVGGFATACLFFLFSIYRVFASCNKLWEVNVYATIFE